MNYRLVIIEDSQIKVIKEADLAVFLKGDYYTLRMEGKNCFLQRFLNNEYIFIYFNGRKLKKTNILNLK